MSNYFCSHQLQFLSWYVFSRTLYIPGNVPCELSTEGYQCN